MIPTAQMLHKSAAQKHCVATQRRHTAACKEMERRLEPEKVFQDVQETKPFGVMVHKLDTALYGIDTLVEKSGIDDLQNVGMWLVLGVKNGDDITFSYFQTQVKLVRLATVLIVRDK